MLPGLSTTKFKKEISFIIPVIEYAAGELQQLLRHVPHTTEWHSSSSLPRPGPIDDLCYMYHRYRFLKRKPLQNLLEALDGYKEFVEQAFQHLQNETADLENVERLTRTYALIAAFVHKEFVAAQSSHTWSRKTGLPLSNERCSVLLDILKIQIQWVARLVEEGKKPLDEMTENTYIHRLRPEIKLAEEDQEPVLRSIAAIWSWECTRNRASRRRPVYSTGIAMSLPPARFAAL